MRPIPKEALGEFYGAVFPPTVAAAFVEMNASYLEGGILYEDPQPATGEKKYGKTEFAEVLKELYGA